MDREKIQILKKILEEKQVIISVTSSSMYPALQPGDRVLVKKSVKYKSGDILVYNSGSFLIVHRLVFKLGPVFFFKGDNGKSFEIKLGYDKIMGKVLAILRS
jgi:signal peptidase I